MTVISIQDKVFSIESKFNQINNYKMNFIKEAQFALQSLKANNYLMKVASENPESLENAIVNIAAIGISLNPVSKEAYLVPRGGKEAKVCLDISYIGLIKLATDSGSIKWAQAEVVREKDFFEFNGVGKSPTHRMDPFSDRGPIKGVYCVSKTIDDEYLVTIMNTQECYEIRDRTDSWKSYKSGKISTCPWLSDEGEMMKKTVIKRASKLWPKSERLNTAVNALNEHEGIDFEKEKQPHVDQSAYLNPPPTDETFSNLRACLSAKGKTEEGLVKYLCTQFKDSKIEKLEDLDAAQVEYSYRILGGK